MRNSHTPYHQPLPTNSAGISANSGPRLMQAASDSARRTAPSARPGIARSTGPGSAMAIACCTRPRRPRWPTVWLAETGAWSATCRPIGTSISHPWLAAPEGAPGGTGGGTGPKAHCSPLLTSNAEVNGPRNRARLTPGRRDASACRCRELEAMPAEGSGRRFLPPAGAHDRWWDGVPRRERPPVCGPGWPRPRPGGRSRPGCLCPCCTLNRPAMATSFRPAIAPDMRRESVAPVARNADAKPVAICRS